jgi:ribosome-binding protein aMBF1 (putative translation factor)
MTRTRPTNESSVPNAVRVMRARKAAEVDREDIIQQALNVRRLTAIDDVMAVLKAAREAAGISLRDLETKLKVPRGNLSRLESGRTNPTVATLKRYADAIGKTLKISVE